MMVLPREILTISLPQPLWHRVYFHVPSDTEELAQGSRYPSTGQLSLCAPGSFLSRFQRANALKKEVLGAERCAADLQHATRGVDSCVSSVVPCAHPCCSEHPNASRDQHHLHPDYNRHSLSFHQQLICFLSHWVALNLK